MVLKLYAATGVGGSGAIVALLLAEKQIPFEHKVISLSRKEHKTPDFVAMHPFGQIPVLDDDGFILYESRAICRYLCDKYPEQGTPLYPVGLKERALVEQAASVELANFYPAMAKVVTELLGKPMRGLPVDQAILASALAELSAKLDVYEVILSKHKFLAGDEFTLADLFHFSYAPMLADAGVDIMTKEDRPHVARWWKALIERPAWVKLKSEGVKGTMS
ncbi:glutathione S-transferase [Mycena polygramma]|nr:glutathione S-transferase [Mycena polygramma]KAJ7660760.1 glutathione S-transferase [Mycena polygramma]